MTMFQFSTEKFFTLMRFLTRDVRMFEKTGLANFNKIAFSKRF